MDGREEEGREAAMQFRKKRRPRGGVPGGENRRVPAGRRPFFLWLFRLSLLSLAGAGPIPPLPAIPPPPAQPPRRRPQAPAPNRRARLLEEAGWAWARGEQALLLEKSLALVPPGRKEGPHLFLLAGILGSRGPCFRAARALEYCGKFLSWYPPAQERKWRNFLEALPPGLARDLPLTPTLARNLARGWREDLRRGRPLLWAADRKTLERDLPLLLRRVEALEEQVRRAEKKIAFHEKKVKAWEKRLKEEWKPRPGRIRGWSGDWIADHIRMHRDSIRKAEKQIRSWKGKEVSLRERIREIREKLEDYEERKKEAESDPGTQVPAVTDQRRDRSPSNLWTRSPARSSRKSPPSPSRSRAAGAKTFPSSSPEERISPRNQPEGLNNKRAGCSFHWATRMLPSDRTATATGRDLSPGPGQVENIIWKVPSRKKTWMHWLKVSAT